MGKDQEVESGLGEFQDKVLGIVQGRVHGLNPGTIEYLDCGA